MSTLSDRLETALKHAKTNQSALARALGVHRQTITALKLGKIGTVRLLEVASLLNVEARWLETGDGDAPAWAAHLSSVPSPVLVGKRPRA